MIQRDSRLRQYRFWFRAAASERHLGCVPLLAAANSELEDMQVRASYIPAISGSARYQARRFGQQSTQREDTGLCILSLVRGRAAAGKF